MYTDERLDIQHNNEKISWLGKVRDARISGSLSDWVSTFHPDRLGCHFEGLFFNGSFNLGQKAVFSDNTAWLVRFPIVGNVCEKLADEKVAMEVEVLTLIRETTTIPVPHIKAWGLAADNVLGLGPFLIMDFIDGVSLGSIFRTDKTVRLLKEDINSCDVEFIYKQFAGILLQLFKLDFDRIGSLPAPKTGFPAPVRPLTFKVHDILQTGGVDSFGDRNQGFETTTEYFQYLVGQDWTQLLQQPNVVTGFYGAKNSYRSFSVLKSLVPQFVNQDWNYGPSKLICDDLGLNNFIVRSEDDLTIVGVVDFEWSYVGPAQLFGSAPWWLLQDRLNNYDISENDEEAPKLVNRYLRHLKIFQRILEEEEKNILGQRNELSRLVKWSVDSGAMWLHMVLSWGFNDPKVLPFALLIKHIGSEKWDQLKQAIPDSEELRQFASEKVSQLEQYDIDVEAMQAGLDKLENHKVLV